MVEDNIRLVLDEYNSSFTSHEILTVIYTFKELSEVLICNVQLDFFGVDKTIDIDLDLISMKSKLVVRSGFIVLRFDKKIFFSSIPGFNPHWDYKHYNEYFRQKFINIGTIDGNHLKCNVFDGSVVNGIRKSILFNFISDELPGCKVFCEQETILYKKINKSVSDIVTFCLEDNNHKEGKFKKL